MRLAAWKMREGVQFLIGADQREQKESVQILLEFNQSRKEIEQSIVAEIKAMIAQARIDLVQITLLLPRVKIGQRVLLGWLLHAVWRI